MNTENTDQILEQLTDIEAVAEDILSDKQQIIDLDKKRQKTREAVRVLAKDSKTQKQWVCFGNMFLKLPTKKTKQILNKDFDQLDSEISDLRKNLKHKVNKLRDLEHKDEIKGFYLQPLSSEELKSIDAYT